MTDPLDTLRPEVKFAIEWIDENVDDTELPEWLCIRVELLRLADENATLERALSKHVLRCAELQSILDTLMPQVSAASERAEKAEAELAALKARIAESPVYEIPLSKPKSEDGWARVIESVRNERSVRGKRVRLLVDEPQDDNAKEGRSRE